MAMKIDLDSAKLARFCEEHHITKLALFGSVLTDHFGPDSDIDVLVEFEPSEVPGMMGISAMERELSAILGHKADMRTPADLSKYFRDQVIQNALVQYAA